MSAKSRRSDTIRIRSRKVTATSPAADDSEKGLTSFPSLSPESSPYHPRAAVPNHAQSPDTPGRNTSSAATPSINALAVPSPAARTALFDDSPLGEHLVPATLHQTTDEHIERLAARTGPVTLIRQLAEDLAQRDAQISAFQRRAEQREKLLRKMLLECEVSNMDIESRLHRLATHEENPGQKDAIRASAKTGLSSNKVGVHGHVRDGSIDDMVHEAMTDTVGASAAGQPIAAVVRHTANGRHQPLPQTRSGSSTAADVAGTTISAAAVAGRSRGTSKGWMDYLWTGGDSIRKSQSRGAGRSKSEEEDPTLADSTVRRTSVAPQRRKGLESDFFTPPGDLSGAGTTPAPETNRRTLRSRTSSAAVASWAVKLIVGGNRTDAGEQNAGGGRQSGDADETRRSSSTSGNAPMSARTALQRINESQSRVYTRRQASASPFFGPSGTVKGNGSSKVTNPAPSPAPSAIANHPGSSGPVEMDAILPPDDQPPTLNQTYHYYHPTEFLIDRFGFIYDQRRQLAKRLAGDEVKRAEWDGALAKELLSPARDTFSFTSDGQSVSTGVAHSEDSSPSPSRAPSPLSPEGDPDPKASKGWQDYLKIATFPTELLSHTPSWARMTNDQASDSDVPARSSPVAGAERGTLVTASPNPLPVASPVVAENATVAHASGATLEASSAALKRQGQEPVRLLLEQLSGLHDLLQKERTVKWNDFLRKVRAERQREGESILSAADGRREPRLTPEAALTDGEMIGVAGLGNKGKIGRAKWKEFKQLVLDGVPVAYRAKIWAECSGAREMRTPGYYDDLVQQGPGDGTVAGQIAMDIHRTLTDNVFFRSGPGAAKLQQVLLAYARRNAAIGYCQGMNLIAASLLLMTPTAEEAFWLLCSLLEQILPAHYYDDSLLASRADQQVLRQYVRQVLPRLSAHLDRLHIELEALTFQWFLSVFTGCLSAEALFRVWDVVLCTINGSTFLFQVALALLSLNERPLLDCRTPAAVYSYINQQMTNHAISIDGLIHASDAFKRIVARPDVEERREKVMQHERARTQPPSSASE
ncbi:MAG: hypothetical protein M1826_005291 [Phylliscum demangeonii]|nr:MAG: hypothetical protein M1826_005291 [Phylliscum demangeonii]